MSAYIDGELTGEEMLAIRRHLSECAECAAEHESTVAIKRALSGLRTVQPRADFAAAILGKLDEVRIPSYQRAFRSLGHFVHQKLSPVAAALAAAGVALVFLSAGTMERQPFDNAQAVTQSPFALRTTDVALLGGASERRITPAVRVVDISDLTSFRSRPALRFVDLER